jgi:hypothetical protein
MLYVHYWRHVFIFGSVSRFTSSVCSRRVLIDIDEVVVFRCVDTYCSTGLVYFESIVW